MDSEWESLSDWDIMINIILNLDMPDKVNPDNRRPLLNKVTDYIECLKNDPTNQFCSDYLTCLYNRLNSRDRDSLSADYLEILNLIEPLVLTY